MGTFHFNLNPYHQMSYNHTDFTFLCPPTIYDQKK